MFEGIEAKATELEAWVSGKLGRPRLTEAAGRMKAGGFHLLSLSAVFGAAGDFDPLLPRTLDPATSGFSSDCYEVG